MKLTYLKFVLPILLLSAAGWVQANGFGITVDKVVGEYTTNTDYDAVNGIFAGEPVQFVYQLFNKDRTAPVDFDDAWITISVAGNDDGYTPPVFDGGLTTSGPNLLPAGMTFVFPSGGSFTMQVRYEKEGKLIVESSFPLSVKGVEAKNAFGATGRDQGFLFIGALAALFLQWLTRLLLKRYRSK